MKRSLAICTLAIINVISGCAFDSGTTSSPDEMVGGSEQAWNSAVFNQHGDMTRSAASTATPYAGRLFPSQLSDQ